MSGPFIFVGTYSVKSGKLEEAKRRCGEVAELVEANEPRLIAFNLYVDEPGHRVSCVQVHPDAVSMEFHLTVIAEHLSTAWEWIDKIESQQAYGTPPATLTAMVREYSEPLAVFPGPRGRIHAGECSSRRLT